MLDILFKGHCRTSAIIAESFQRYGEYFVFMNRAGQNVALIRVDTVDQIYHLDEIIYDSEVEYEKN